MKFEVDDEVVIYQRPTDIESAGVIGKVLKELPGSTLGCGDESPVSIANRVSPATVWMSSFFMRLSRWVSTVRELIPRSAAISLLLRPSAIRASTSRSLVVRRSKVAFPAVLLREPATTSVSCLAMLGLKNGSPPWTVRTASRTSAGPVSFRRYP